MTGWSNLPAEQLTAGFACLVLLAPAPLAFGQFNPEADLQDQYESIQQTVAELEATLGRYDPALIENLTSLADSAAALNLHFDARTTVERAIQIQRLNLGLHSAEQIPLYFQMMEHDISAGNWRGVNESMGYLYYLLLEKRANSEESIIEDLVRLSEFHLIGVAGDAESERARHFQRAEELTLLAIEISEFVWDATDLRRIDLYYSLIKQFYLQSAAIDRGGVTGYSLRAVVPESNWVRPARIVRARYYRAGLRLFEEIQRTFAESTDNPREFLAMVDLYRADWQVLFSDDNAEEGYRVAYSGLIDSGYDQDTVTQLLLRPQVLPIPIFHISAEQALAALQPSKSSSPSPDPTSPDLAIQFSDWFDFMPAVPFPRTAPDLQGSVTGNYSEIQLNVQLDSLNRVSRWIQGTYETHLGVVGQFEILTEPDWPDFDRQFLSRRLHFVHFRPRLENGVPRTFEGRLIYRAARSDEDNE